MLTVPARLEYRYMDGALWTPAHAAARPELGLAALLAAVVLSLTAAPAAGDGPGLDDHAPADTSSPRATLESFIEAANRFHAIAFSPESVVSRTDPQLKPHARRLLDCMDVRELPEHTRQQMAYEVAACLKEIIDRVEINLDEVPDAAAIEAAGGPEKLSRFQIPGTRLAIAHIDEGPQRHEYLFTAGTVGRAIEYFEDVRGLPYRVTGPPVSPNLYRSYVQMPGNRIMAAIVDWLPDWTERRIVRTALWQWAGLIVVITLAVTAMLYCYRWQKRLSARFRNTSVVRYWMTLAFSIVAVFVPLAVDYLAVTLLTIRGEPLYVVSFTTHLVSLLAVIIALFGATNRVAATIITVPQINPEGLDAQFIRILSRLLGIVAAVILFLEGGRYLGIPLSTLLASAGVGGLTLALAAQDTLKTIFGTIMLLADKPFYVGDRIKFASHDGVVEDIGLRSTRVRLLSGHEVTIPNDKLVGTDIENVTRRPHIRRVADVRIPLTTPRLQLERAVAIVEEALAEVNGLDPEMPPRVHLNELNDDSFNIRFMYWYTPPDYWAFADEDAKLNLRIVRGFEAEKIAFSLPRRITHTSTQGEQLPVEVRISDDRPS